MADAGVRNPGRSDRGNHLRRLVLRPGRHYSADQNYFTSAVGGDPLTAPASNNGVYAYGTGGGFPSSTFRSTNYWVDAVFETTLPIDTTAPKVTS